jgi:hypothetical protein
VSTDYFPPIQRAVQNLSPNTPEARRALYDKARTALLRQLRGADPALTDGQITKERLLLEDAIRRIETDMLRPEMPPQPYDLDGPDEGYAPERGLATDVAEAEPPGYDDEPDDAYETEPARDRPPAFRPLEQRRPRAPSRRQTGGRGRLIAAAGVVALLLVGGGVAATLYLGNLIPSPIHVGDATKAPLPTPAKGPEVVPPAQSGKLTDRLGEESAGPAPAPAASPSPGPAPTSAPGTAEPPPGQQAALPEAAPAPAPAPAPTPAAPAQPATPPAAQPLSPAPKPGAVVAQSAILYEEQPDSPQRGQAFQGTVAWRTESVSAGANAPLEMAVKGDVDIPERKIHATLTLRKNADPALPATHTLEIQFVVPPDFPNGGISNVPGVLMKQEAQQRGAPLQGLSVKVTNGFFLVGLSDAPTDSGRNAQLLKEREWIDIPVLYDNGRRAILTLEKGVPGNRAFADAFNAWDSPSAAAQP